MRLLPLLLLVPSLVHAETAVGFRIGGYGFREPGFAGGWHDCRMNGVGVFAARSVAPLVEVEAGLDAYFAAAEEEPSEHSHGAMDRVSTLLSVAGAVRPLPAARVSPYAQLGVGLELTRVTVEAMESSRVLPLAFFGIGADLRVGRARLGMVLRIHAMGHFEHDAELTVEPELASQLQFYAALGF
jgi:hypothetical protein